MNGEKQTAESAYTGRHVTETRCGLTQEDFHPEGDEPCVDGGTPEQHPRTNCEQCGRSLALVGTCCWDELCSDCEDANQAAMDRARGEG